MIKKNNILIVLFALFLPVFSAISQDIHQAAKSGEFEKVKASIEEDHGLVNAKDDRGRTPLHLAAESGHIEIVEFLISSGAEINVADVNSNTPLHYTATAGKVEAAEFLLAKGAEVDARNHEKCTPLHLAASFNHKPIMKLLIEKGAEVDSKEYRGGTPLLLSVWRAGDLEAAKMLVNHGADINVKIEGTWVTPIAMAAQYGYRDIVDYFIDKGAAIDEKSRILVRFSVEKGLVKLFWILAEKGADLNMRTNNGGTFLHAAAEGGSKEIIQLLLKKGFDFKEPDRYGWTPLHYAAYNNRKEAIELFLEKGADSDSRTLSGKSAFNIASEKKFKDILQILVSKGADRSSQKFPVLKGKYLGQVLPKEKPEIFALGIVSSLEAEHGSVTFTPDGKMMFWSSGFRKSPTEGVFKVYSTKFEEDHWTAPQIAFFAKNLDYQDDIPFVSPGGKRLFFMSTRPLKEGGKGEKENIWFTDKTAEGWSDPKPVSDAVNVMSMHFQFSVSGKGTLYFGSREGSGFGGRDIYRAVFKNGNYLKPENLGEIINTRSEENAPFIAPDESYLIFSAEGRPDGLGMADLYISYRDNSGNWTKPVNMNKPINTGAPEGSPMVSPDGKYLFFNSGRNGNYDIYWVDAKIIKDLKPEELK
jgi:ankyrin repeat protein